MITCSKLYSDFPAAHRQHNHKGHCSLIHGHNWSFEFTFAAERLDANGFVVDFGDLGWLKLWLAERFDHTLLLNDSDPSLLWLVDMLSSQFAKVQVVPDASCEGLALYVFANVQDKLTDFYSDRGVYLTSVKVMEDSKNFATYSAQLCELLA